MASSKGARVADFWVVSGSGGGWNFSFGRHFHDWELEEVQGFLGTVNSQSISHNLSDRIWWKEAKNGSFSVKTCGACLLWLMVIGAFCIFFLNFLIKKYIFFVGGLATFFIFSCR